MRGTHGNNTDMDQLLHTLQLHNKHEGIELVNPISTAPVISHQHQNDINVPKPYAATTEYLFTKLWNNATIQLIDLVGLNRNCGKCVDVLKS